MKISRKKEKEITNDKNEDAEVFQAIVSSPVSVWIRSLE